MTDTDLWSLERELWTGGAPVFSRLCDAHALMAFPPPVGVLTLADALDALEQAPRWTRVEMTAAKQTRSGDVAVLGYHAEAAGPDGETRKWVCASTWRATDAGWRLVQHSQIPAEAGSQAER